MDEAGEQVPLVDGKVAIATRYAYALGHIFNDLAAAMWFSYTLLFLQRISLIQPVVAGALLLLGLYSMQMQIVYQTLKLLRSSSNFIIIKTIPLLERLSFIKISTF